MIDWDSLEIIPTAEEQIVTTMVLMDEDAMYAFVGLTTDYARTEQERQTTENEKC